MYITLDDLDKLKVRTFREVAQRLENAAKHYRGCVASEVLQAEADRLLVHARKLEQRRD